MGRENQGWSISEVDRRHPMIMKKPALMTTTCSPYSVDIKNLRLHVRGVKVDWLRQCLVFNQDVEEMTVAQFWRSSIGEHIQPYLSDAGTSLSEILQVVDTDPWDSRHDHKDIHLGLCHLLKISKNRENADRVLGIGASEISDLLAPLEDTDQGVVFALRAVLRSFGWRSCILTDNNNFGLVPECDKKRGRDLAGTWMFTATCRAKTTQRKILAYLHSTSTCSRGIRRSCTFQKQYPAWRYGRRMDGRGYRAGLINTRLTVTKYNRL
jgi:hypothetical protein